ncbi:TetR/AcrR family transcriptional regulator [Nocardia flavorosea]|uniref:TetR/AcrR family transcriptional regulator n=1 Tax=Nocardia flavorosea TaxID=53429 RepID=A0A846YB16_9NOCA|nr:TetR/AcrR family transcriptional regulator [Nocardia flavorosea]NKY56047.1 TetR/AcrR family transcriptional regulator [Nocardia flavorosea]
MGIQNRRERERADRYRLIVDTARELAETEGWDAVTIRKLADRIEYSQPVLYSHFAGKRAIVTAVALDGINEAAAVLHRARTAAPDESTALAAVARAYTDFAAENPAVYDAMFVLPTDLTFGDGAPEPLRNAFTELVTTFAPFAAETDVETLTETIWSTLHGLATLERNNRLRPGHRQERLTILQKWLETSRNTATD